MPDARAIVITLDDLPVSPDCPWRIRRRRQIFGGIMSSLRTFKISTIGFAIGEHVTDGDEELLDRFVADGHLLGNHSFTHRPLDMLSITEFESEILACDAALVSWLTRPKRFRYPLLRTGNDALKRDLSLQVLHRCGYTPMWTTVDNSDWEFNFEYTKAVSNQARAECAVRYIDHVVQSAEFYFDLGRSVTEDRIVHTISSISMPSMLKIYTRCLPVLPLPDGDSSIRSMPSRTLYTRGLISGWGIEACLGFIKFSANHKLLEIVFK